MKFKALLIKAASHGVAQVLGVILFLGGAGIGVSLLSAPETFAHYHTLTAAFGFASPVAWGVMFLTASIALVVSVLVQPLLAQLPALMLGTVFLGFGLLALVNGPSPMVWAFVALGWISIFTQVVCWAEESREAIHHYKPN